MNTQIVNVPEKGLGHKTHAKQECPGDVLAGTFRAGLKAAT